MISKKQYIVFGRLLYEFLILNACILLVLLLRKPEVLSSIADQSYLLNIIKLLLVFNLSWILIVLYNGDPDFYVSHSFQKRTKHLLLNAFLFIGVASTLAILFKIQYFNRTVFLAPIFLFSFLNLALMKSLFEIMKRKINATSDYHILVLGAGQRGQQVQSFAQRYPHLGYDIVGFLDDDSHKSSNRSMKFLGAIKDLPKVLDSKQVDEIFIALPSQREHDIRTAIEVADFRGVRVNIVPETPVYSGHSFRSYSLDDMPVFKLRQTPLDNFANFLVKKAFDFSFALLVLAAISPILLTIALLIYLEGKGPILYKPLRKGEAGDSFVCYKFRTMSECDDPVNGSKSTLPNDPRITRLGKVLRKFDLDELPQFFNVLKGDMSVVGPRPHRVNLQQDFRKIVNDYMVRHYVKPGITGWAQVNGWRGPTGTMKQKTERIRHDLWYIENWSFWLDLKIILRTVFDRQTRKNAF